MSQLSPLWPPMRIIWILLLSFGTITTCFAQEGKKPYTLADVEAFLGGGVAPSRIVMLVQDECRSFEMDQVATSRLVNAGANSEVISGLRDACFVSITVEEPDEEPVQEVDDQPVEVQNRSPIAEAIPEQHLTVGESVSFDMPAYFNDPEQGDLTYSAPVSSDPQVVSVHLSGTSVVVTPQKEGEAVVSIAASDPEGAEARLAFGVSVGREKRGLAMGYKLLLGSGAATLVGTVAYLVLGSGGGGGSEPGPTGGTPALPGPPGLPPGN